MKSQSLSGACFPPPISQTQKKNPRNFSVLRKAFMRFNPHILILKTKMELLLYGVLVYTYITSPRISLSWRTAYLL